MYVGFVDIACSRLPHKPILLASMSAKIDHETKDGNLHRIEI